LFGITLGCRTAPCNIVLSIGCNETNSGDISRRVYCQERHRFRRRRRAQCVSRTCWDVLRRCNVISKTFCTLSKRKLPVAQQCHDAMTRTQCLCKFCGSHA
jgi:hypothetical protein